MKILRIIKGFVTNSSSANYWLDDGVLEEEEITTNSVDVYLNTEKENYTKTNLKKAIQEPILDFTIWFIFSLIIIFISLHKKIKK